MTKGKSKRKSVLGVNRSRRPRTGENKVLPIRLTGLMGVQHSQHSLPVAYECVWAFSESWPAFPAACRA